MTARPVITARTAFTAGAGDAQDLGCCEDGDGGRAHGHPVRRGRVLRAEAREQRPGQHHGREAITMAKQPG